MYKKTKKEPVTLSSVIEKDAVYICKQDIICKDGVFVKGSLVMLDAVRAYKPNKQPQCLKICDFESGCLNYCISLFGEGSIVDYNYEIGPENFDEFFLMEEYVTAKWKSIVAKRGSSVSMLSRFRDNRFINDKHKLIESFTPEEREKYRMQSVIEK